MKRIILVSIFYIFLFGLLAQSQTKDPKDLVSQKIEACYLCANVPGGYIRFFLPNTIKKEFLAFKLFHCKPFEIVRCPTDNMNRFYQRGQSKILGTITEKELNN